MFYLDFDFGVKPYDDDDDDAMMMMMMMVMVMIMMIRKRRRRIVVMSFESVKWTKYSSRGVMLLCFLRTHFSWRNF